MTSKRSKASRAVTGTPRPTLQERLKRGSVIRTAEFSYEQFQDCVDAINAQFGLSIVVMHETYIELRNGLRLVAGAVDIEPPITRKDIRAHLDRLRFALVTAIEELESLRPGLIEETGFEAVHLLAETMGGGSFGDGASLLETYLRLLESLSTHCDRAAVILEEAPAKTGRRPLEFYAPFMRLMVGIATKLGIKVSTAGDRVEDPYATPFTTLVFAVERFLPRDAWSNSLPACAKRIDRALNDLGVVRQNSSAS
jgi:hypothetical protein